MAHDTLDPAVPPRLPSAQEQYDARFMDQYSNVLRLYFNRLSNLTSSLISPTGGQYVDFPNGLFFNTASQTAAAINTAYAMTFNSTDITNGVYIGSPTSRVYVDTVNLYNIQFSAQLINTAGGAHNVWIWLRKNGTDVPDSATTLRLQGNNTELVAAWNFLLSMNAGDYFELMWEVSDTSVFLQYDAATAVHPAIPSVILTVTDNISSRGAT